ncbi:phosphatidate cytidylyltransferase [Arcobacter sp. CECT 8985]|uniref:phosphatidate cytidylyltransferase n=1 Tax=Arcobacter sp. CECT 8985 TaxID=1935424 RepID=UPI00100BE618|nr:phosphatidate cytidylyltransferase [Arcobacter sp. CECT 8985]RXJ83414.1 phosphatidate cytidylyltransferase [Arcobacter sp. CECT 8985]
MKIFDPKIYITIFVIYIFLFISFIIYKLIKYKTKKDNIELSQRISSWFIMITSFVIFIYLNDTLAIFFLAFLSYLSYKEYISLIPTRIADRRIIFYGYLFIIPQYYFAYVQWYEMFIITIPVYFFLFISFRQMLIGETKGFIENTSKIYWGSMLFIFAISHCAYLFRLESNNVHGYLLVLYLVFLTEFNDVLQYVCGKIFGKRKIVPKVSPNKTVEGLIGATFFIIILAIVFRFLTPFSIVESIFAGLIISLGGFIGDVIISMVKRDIGVKDAGNFISGHGGIIDRLDSLTYTAPLFFHFVYYLYF